MPGNKCSNCIAYSFSCTYVEAAKVCASIAPLTPTDMYATETGATEGVSFDCVWSD